MIGLPHAGHSFGLQVVIRPNDRSTPPTSRWSSNCGIAAVFIAAAPILQERRRQQEENERRRHEEERRRYEERQRQQLERNRLRGFLGLASRWKEVETARLFLDALTNRATGDLDDVLDHQTVGEWIVWARERLTAHDPLEADPAAVFWTIASIDQWTYRND